MRTLDIENQSSETTMRSNKIHNADLFTVAANDQFRKHIKTQSKQALEVIKAKVDWPRLLAPLEAAIAKDRASKSNAGRRPHSLLVIVRCFILQAMYNLSDPRLEEEIADRRSFQIFLELNSHDDIPDETSICRYRELFARLNLDKKLFGAFNRQLADLGLIVGTGTIVDATLKQAQAFGGGRRDHDAQYTSRKGKMFFGYKGHVGMDTESEIVHTAEFTTANISDTELFEKMLLGSERKVYADKGYASKGRRDALNRQGIFCGILWRGARAHPLTKQQERTNKRLAVIRSAVERPFAFLERILGYTRCRYYDLRRNRFQFLFSLMVYNIRKSITLTMP
jgi:transposase, IS5 family